MKRVPTHDNIVSFPKHLKGKLPDECMCPFCEVVLETGLKDKAYVGYNRQVASYLLQLFIESGEKSGIAVFKKAVQSLNREGTLEKREEAPGSTRASTRSTLKISNNCNMTTGSVLTTSQKSEQIADILFPRAETLVDKSERRESGVLKDIVSILYGELGVK